MNTTKCDLCGHEGYDELYTPIGTKRDNVVVICRECHLVYSIHDTEKPYSREPNPSCDADWGNVRFCKGQRFDSLESDMPTTVKKILDVGSSRGHFVRWAQKKMPLADVVALEPDVRIASYPARMEFHGTRVEEARLPLNYFDFVYCCQTLEHTDSPTEVLQSIYDVMEMKGILFVEVPNTPEVIGYKDNTEEYFIDKHNYHFTHHTMRQYLEKIGFEIAFIRDDRLNISVFAQKTGVTSDIEPDETPMRELVGQYERNITVNRAKVANAVKKINDIMDTGMKVAFWGANTLMDLMIKYEGLDPKRVEFLADDYMCDCIETLHGIPIHSSKDFRVYNPDVVIVLARFNADLMSEKARAFGVRNVIKFVDLL